MKAAACSRRSAQGRQRIFSRADRDRLALILKGKKLGFTLAEISEMIEAQAGRASEHALKLTAEKCLEQIAFFERQMREAGEALARAAPDSPVAVRACGPARRHEAGRHAVTRTEDSPGQRARTLPARSCRACGRFRPWRGRGAGSRR